MNRLLSSIGILATSAYMAGLLWFFDGRVNEIKSMSPNNIGDFMAGAFGPLAILWLILGFFQQGIELRQNTRALELQADELRNSVEQQRSLVEVSRKQMEAEIESLRFERERQARSAHPNFVFQGVGASFHGVKGTYQSYVKNLGNSATDVTFSIEPEVEYSSISKVFSWSHGEVQVFQWRYKTAEADQDLTLTVSYIDSAGVPGTKAFRILPVRGGANVMAQITNAG